MKIREANTLINLGYMKLQFLSNTIRKRMERALKRHSTLSFDNPKLERIENRVMKLNDQLFEVYGAIDILKRTQGGYMPFVDKNGEPFTLCNNGEPIYIGFN
jgi:hypothetical protein